MLCAAIHWQALWDDSQQSTLEWSDFVLRCAWKGFYSVRLSTPPASVAPRPNPLTICIRHKRRLLSHSILYRDYFIIPPFVDIVEYIYKQKPENKQQKSAIHWQPLQHNTNTCTVINQTINGIMIMASITVQCSCCRLSNVDIWNTKKLQSLCCTPILGHSEQNCITKFDLCAMITMLVDNQLEKWIVFNQLAALSAQYSTRTNHCRWRTWWILAKPASHRFSVHIFCASPKNTKYNSDWLQY